MIGIVDSGLGGLAVAHWIRRILPHADLLYIADQAHAPYGDRDPEEVAALTRSLVDELLTNGASTIVLASNTISAAALHRLRQDLPHLPFVGMEPAVKPAVAQSRAGTVAVLGTTATIEGPLLADMISRHGAGAHIVPIALPGLVDLVEAGQGDSPEAEEFLTARLGVGVEAGADTWVLACTHYTFARRALERVLPDDASIIDPAEAVATQVGRVDPGTGSAHAVARTTGPIEAFRRRVAELDVMAFDRIEGLG